MSVAIDLGEMKAAALFNESGNDWIVERVNVVVPNPSPKFNKNPYNKGPIYGIRNATNKAHSSESLAFYMFHSNKLLLKECFIHASWLE